MIFFIAAGQALYVESIRTEFFIHSKIEKRAFCHDNSRNISELFVEVFL